MWATVRLGDVAMVIAGQSPAGENYNKDGIGTPFMQGKKDYGDKFPNPPKVWTTSVTKLAEKGDILMSVRAPVGALNIANQQVCIGRGLAAIRASEKIELDYLFYALLQISARLEGSSGAIFNSINKKQIEEIEFLLPPLNEQRRIVDKLDDAFAEIDEALELARKRDDEVKRLQASLLSSVLNNIDYSEMKLGAILKTGAGGTPLKSNKAFYENGTIRWLLSGAVCEKYINNSQTYITEEGLNNSSAKLFPQDTVLIAMYGATAGQVGILKTEAATNQAVCGIYPSSDYLPEFLYYYLTNYKKTLLLEVSGVAQPNLSQVKIKNIPLPKIPLSEQQNIVAKLESAFTEIATINIVIQNMIEDYQTLKSAILKQELQSEAA